VCWEVGVGVGVGVGGQIIDKNGPARDFLFQIFVRKIISKFLLWVRNQPKTKKNLI
jgi:hypothetical protein